MLSVCDKLKCFDTDVYTYKLCVYTSVIVCTFVLQNSELFEILEDVQNLWSGLTDLAMVLQQTPLGLHLQIAPL